MGAALARRRGVCAEIVAARCEPSGKRRRWDFGREPTHEFERNSFTAHPKAPAGIVQSYDTLRLPDVYAVVSYYLAHPEPFEEYLLQCDQQAQAVRRKLENAGMTGRVTKEELLARGRAKGLLRDQAAH